MSKMFSLNAIDWKSWGTNIILFLWPVLVIILTQLAQWLTVDWTIVYTTAIWLLLNLLKKFLADNQPTPTL